MSCPYLEYRTTDGDREFDAERAYCLVADRFVSPMKADVCNERFEFAYDEHCELYARHEGGRVQ